MAGSRRRVEKETPLRAIKQRERGGKWASADGEEETEEERQRAEGAKRRWSENRWFLPPP